MHHGEPGRRGDELLEVRLGVAGPDEATLHGRQISQDLGQALRLPLSPEVRCDEERLGLRVVGGRPAADDRREVGAVGVELHAIGRWFSGGLPGEEVLAAAVAGDEALGAVIEHHRFHEPVPVHGAAKLLGLVQVRVAGRGHEVPHPHVNHRAFTHR